MADTTARGVDAVAFLSNDHRAVEEFFKMLDSPGVDRGAVIDRIADELTVHSELEEEILYPVIRKEVSGGRQLASHAEDEHQEVAKMLKRLRRLDPNSSQADALLQELRQSFQEHVAEEQGPDGLFAKLRDAVGSERLREMGTELSEAKTAKVVKDPAPEGEPPPSMKDVAGSFFVIRGK